MAPGHLLLRQRDKLDYRVLLPQLGCTAPIDYSTSPMPLFQTKRALVRVQDGCDFRCAYCIVPSLRGPPRSRPPAAILEETRRLLDAGHMEIVLTGANLGCYDYHGMHLIQLLEKLSKLTELQRLRLSSIEITTVEKAVIDFMADSKILCRSLHLPLQSGSAKVLRRMGRRYDPVQYARVAAYAIEKLGRVGLGTDLLVGFPGETDRDLQATEQMVRNLSFSNLHIFCYSPRPGTAAIEMSGQIAEPVKTQRQLRLRRLGTDLRHRFARQWVGGTVEVLAEQADRQGNLSGWTGEYLPAQVAVCSMCRSAHLPRLVRCVPHTAEKGVLLAKCGCTDK
ncbi:MAG: MiaB/RimO family radical SAM methylthiotransferase [Lentisphaerae bacterium]|nr:MiaB/RimO family radical SAM methylthiotransferase [Lentisphaerota bacterium]